jgi:uncharacterized protein (DUF697 family)
MHHQDQTLQEFEEESFDQEFESDAEWNEVLEENELNELAAELLEVGNDQEMERFFGGLLKKVSDAAGSIISSPVGSVLKGALKNVAKQALPMVGAAVGNFVAPGVGLAAGKALGTMASKALGLELEGLSQEDREFEVAKQVVRLAADATRTALTAPESVPAQEVAYTSVNQAMQRYAPGMVPQGHRGGIPRSGRWELKRGRIIIDLRGA